MMLPAGLRMRLMLARRFSSKLACVVCPSRSIVAGFGEGSGLLLYMYMHAFIIIFTWYRWFHILILPSAHSVRRRHLQVARNALNIETIFDLTAAD